jgi:hypothetical protein
LLIDQLHRRQLELPAELPLRHDTLLGITVSVPLARPPNVGKSKTGILNGNPKRES